MDTRHVMRKESIFYLRKDLWEDIEIYKDDYKHVIRQREKSRIPFKNRSPQIGHRKRLLSHMKKICLNKRLTHCCLHLAVYILDIFMDNHSIVDDKLLLVTNVCLWIAAKLEETSKTTLKIADLNETVDNQYSPDDYKKMEALILIYFFWYVMFPTPAHYTHYYMQAILCMNDINSDTRVRELILDLHRHITVYLDKVIDDVRYMQNYPPSVLAAAIIAASRSKENLLTWTEQLHNLTELTISQIREPLDLLLGCTTFDDNNSVESNNINNNNN